MQKRILLILFHCLRFVVDDCDCDPQVQNAHDDKPYENWRRNKRKIKITINTSVQFTSRQEALLTCVSPVVMTVVKIRADKQSKHSMSIQQTGEVLSFPFVSLTQTCVCGQSPGESADLPRVL